MGLSLKLYLPGMNYSRPKGEIIMKQSTEKELTCITCPLGCTLHVTLDNGTFVSVTGNHCKRGADYAYAETTHPVRVLTTTISIKNQPGRVLPVKSDLPMPKEKLFDAMKLLNQTTAVLPVKIGDVILKNVFGVNIVASSSME